MMTNTPARTYEAIGRYLRACPDDEATLTFGAIEALLGMPLPASAWTRQWWANTPASGHAESWLAAGWRVRWVRRTGAEAAVTFARAD